MTVFSGFDVKLVSVMLGTVIFSFLLDLKIKSFILDSVNESLLALSQFVSNFISLFMTQDISDGHLLPNNRFFFLQNGELCICLEHY